VEGGYILHPLWDVYFLFVLSTDYASEGILSGGGDLAEIPNHTTAAAYCHCTRAAAQSCGADS
jgi:hypothetical protein